MLLTGVASPEGELSPFMRATVLLVAFLSIPFFAVPAAMLTWGFEGEAQRLAAREQRRVTRRAAYAGSGASVDVSDSSSEDEEYDDYLERLGGERDDEDERERAGERALAFFMEMAATPASLRAGLSPTSPRADGATAGGSEGRGNSMLLGRALRLARTLKRQTADAVHARQRRRDALELLERLDENVREGLSSDEAERLEQRLRAFALAVSDAGGSGDHAASEQGGVHEATASNEDDAEARMAALQRDVVALRRTMVAGLSELKSSMAELAHRLPPPPAAP